MNLLRSSFYLAVIVAISACGNDSSANVQRQREQQFEQMMSGSTLVGYSAMDHKPGLSDEERYRIDKVSRLTGDTWLFQTRMKYGSREIPVPIPVSIQWAGDTPVITLTDMNIPGVGTYTARVVLYRGRYAGTWSGKKVGGQLFGRIVSDEASNAK